MVNYRVNQKLYKIFRMIAINSCKHSNYFLLFEQKFYQLDSRNISVLYNRRKKKIILITKIKVYYNTLMKNVKKTVKNEKVSMIIFCVNKLPYHFLSLNY